MIKYIVLLAVLLNTLNGFQFQLEGKYDIESQCDMVFCPNTPFHNGYDFLCPEAVEYGASITKKEDGLYEFTLRTATSWSHGGPQTQYFSDENITDKNIQIPLQYDYVLTLEPCYQGKHSHQLCPEDPFYRDKVLIASKSRKSVYEKDCYFSMIKRFDE